LVSVLFLAAATWLVVAQPWKKEVVPDTAGQDSSSAVVSAGPD
jgi:hypothetical protein